MKSLLNNSFLKTRLSKSFNNSAIGQLFNSLSKNPIQSILIKKFKKSLPETTASNGKEFLIVCIANYKFHILKCNDSKQPQLKSYSIVDIPATCLGDSDVIKLDEFSEIVLGQIVRQDPEVNLPTYILFDPDYFSSDTTNSNDVSGGNHYLSLSPFIPVNTLFTVSKFSYSKDSIQFLEKNLKSLESISKLHNQADKEMSGLSKDFVRLDFVNREFIQKITAPFSQISMPICCVTSLDYPIVDSIQKQYKGFNFYLSCGKLSSILYIIHSDGFLKSIKIPVGVKMYHYPITGTIEYDQLLARLVSIVNKRIDDSNLKLISSHIIISGLDIDLNEANPSLFKDSRLKFLSFNQHIESLKLNKLDRTNLISKDDQTPTVKKILFSTLYLKSTAIVK